MARIIYGVAGEGFGHSSRSHLIGQRLIDAGHDVMFVGSQKSLVYLKEYFAERVKEIFGLSFAYEDGRIDKSQTLRQNLMNLPTGNKLNDELFREHFEPFDPDLVISDFEPFSAWWAWRKGVPFVSIDHEHFLTLCDLEHPEKNWFSRLTASLVTTCYYVGAVRYVILNFFRAPVKIEGAVVAPPIVRPVVTALEASVGDHILVYSTSGKGGERLREILNGFGSERFLVYGYDRDEEYKNCIFKKRSTQGFLRDLASARGVVASAGFSLISECLYLQKKMYVLPLAGQYEQIINGRYIEKLGLGVASQQLDAESMRKFLGVIDEPLPEDDRIIWPDNEGFFRLLGGLLGGLENPVAIKPD